MLNKENNSKHKHLVFFMEIWLTQHFITFFIFRRSSLFSVQCPIVCDVIDDAAISFDYFIFIYSIIANVYPTNMLENANKQFYCDSNWFEHF